LRTSQLGVCKELQPPLSPELVYEHLTPLFSEIALIAPRLRNFSNFGDGVTAVLAHLEEGSLAVLEAGLCLATTFLLRIGREVVFAWGWFQ